MFKKVGVIGAGQMGSGIAQVCIANGFEVLLCDIDEKIIKASVEKIENGIKKMAEKKLIQESPSDVMKRLKTTINLHDFKDSELVVESVVENYEVKAEIFRRLDSIVPKETILSTNTSSISITKIASNTTLPERVLGVHFMNPVPLMKLVEIVKGLRTSEEAVKISIEFVQKLKKEVVISKDSPGFIVNRVLFGMLSEAIRLLEEGGAEVQDIDKGMKLGTNHPMGPFELMDLIGLDTCLFILNVLYEEFGDPKYKPPILLKRMVAAGYLGKKSGMGFYKYGS